MAKKIEKEEKDTKKKENNRHSVEVKIEGEDWTKAVDAAFEKTKKNLTVDGFRKGHVPREVYDRKFGDSALFMEAAEDVLPSAYSKALLESKLVPVVQPDVELKSIDKDGVVFTFKIITKPEVKIKKYKGLNVKKDKVSVTDEEIEHELGHLKEQYTELVPKDGKIENGDVAIIDYEGFKDGVAFDGGKGEDYSLEIGSNTFIPGFEEGLIGLKAGDEKDLELTFPKDYHAKDLAGAKVVFKVKVKDVKTKVEPKYDEDFFDDLGLEGVDSLDKLKDYIKKELTSRKELDSENAYLDKLLEEVAKNVEVDIPEEMVNEEVDDMLKRFDDQLKHQGMSLDLYYKLTGSNEADLKSQMEKEAYNNVLYRLMLDEVITLEKVEVSDKDVDDEAEKLAKEYSMDKDQLIMQYGGKETFKYNLQLRKVIDLLKEYNK